MWYLKALSKRPGVYWQLKTGKNRMMNVWEVQEKLVGMNGRRSANAASRGLPPLRHWPMAAGTTASDYFCRYSVCQLPPGEAVTGRQP